MLENKRLRQEKQNRVVEAICKSKQIIQGWELNDIVLSGSVISFSSVCKLTASTIYLPLALLTLSI